MPSLLSPGRGRQDSPPTEVSQRLRPMRHRRVALVRTAVLLALTCGPVALASQWSAPSSAAHPAGRTAQQTAQSSAQASDPGGFAAAFVGVWLRGGPDGAQESAAQKTVRSMAPGVALPEFDGRPPAVGQVWAVRSVRVRPGAWSVTVAALLEPGAKASVRYFRVPVLFEDRGGRGAFAVAAAPAAAGGPASLDVPSSPYPREVRAGSALATTGSEFLRAYLGGAGGAERYLAPRIKVPALGFAYSSVRTERVSSSGGTDGAVGAEGARVRIRVEVSARDAQGVEWPLTYALRLASRDGRWEVLGLESGLEDEDSSSGKGGA